MMYSCAIWGDEEGGVRGDLIDGPRPGDLEAAQARKIRTILTKARVRPGDRLLEIGSGWGAMAITASSVFYIHLRSVLTGHPRLQAALLGCTVDTVTLSIEQMAMVEERARDSGVSDRVRVHLCDYRELPESFKHQFDAFVSCEMIEVRVCGIMSLSDMRL